MQAQDHICGMEGGGESSDMYGWMGHGTEFVEVEIDAHQGHIIR